MITDRTQQDVSAAALLRLKIQSGQTLTDTEKTAFERGALTITTLNRIENKQKEIAELLKKYAYQHGITAKTDWAYSDIMLLDEYNRILNNLTYLKTAFFVNPDTPETPTDLTDYKKTNAAEKILVDLEKLIEILKTNFKKCGTFQCGGDYL